jgi:3-oxoacyl-[acyl-carrier protein] reductase
MRIDNKRIIVVGASRGLGRGIAAALAAAGARVLAIARDGAEMVRLLDDGLLATQEFVLAGAGLKLLEK